MEILYKIGGIILKNRNVLVARKKDTYLIPGGKIKTGEQAEQCLSRELNEELGVTLVSQRYFGEYEDKAALDPDKMINIELFVVSIKGEPSPHAEINDIKYINLKVKY